MEKIWLKNYPAGVPAEINPEAYQSLVDIFQQSCQKYQHKTALYSMGTRLSYGRLAELSQHFAAYLQQACGLKPNERIAIMLPNVTCLLTTSLKVRLSRSPQPTGAVAVEAILTFSQEILPLPVCLRFIPDMFPEPRAESSSAV